MNKNPRRSTSLSEVDPAWASDFSDALVRLEEPEAAYHMKMALEGIVQHNSCVSDAALIPALRRLCGLKAGTSPSLRSLFQRWYLDGALGGYWHRYLASQLQKPKDPPRRAKIEDAVLKILAQGRMPQWGDKGIGKKQHETSIWKFDLMLVLGWELEHLHGELRPAANFVRLQEAMAKHPSGVILGKD